MKKVTLLKTRISGTNERAIGALLEIGSTQIVIPLMSLTYRPIKELRVEISNVLCGKCNLNRVFSNKTINWYYKKL